MTDDDQQPPAVPRLMVIGGGADTWHALFHISFVDPDLDEPRQYNVEANHDFEPFKISPAGSQAHLPGGEPFLAEATRIAQAIFEATFPHHVREPENPTTSGPGT